MRAGTLDHLLAELAQEPYQLATVEEGRSYDVSMIAAPIFDSAGEVTAAITVTGLPPGMPALDLVRIGQRTRGVGLVITKRTMGRVPRRRRLIACGTDRRASDAPPTEGRRGVAWTHGSVRNPRPGSPGTSVAACSTAASASATSSSVTIVVLAGGGSRGLGAAAAAAAASSSAFFFCAAS